VCKASVVNLLERIPKPGRLGSFLIWNFTAPVQ
jgi:hypothetical protein